ncbi:MAG: hypothetical protein KC656_05545, partial [Myxococcales bacterium]|nr:hypothetical protein [Myxococcales bacterium]
GAVVLQSERSGTLRALDATGADLLLACPELTWDACPRVGDTPLAVRTDYGGLDLDGRVVLDANHDLSGFPDRVWRAVADSVGARGQCGGRPVPRSRPARRSAA